jgi:hypothetical protein
MKDKDFEALCEMTLHVPKIDPIVEAVIAKVEKTNDLYFFPCANWLVYSVRGIQAQNIENAMNLAIHLKDCEHGQEKAYIIEQLRKRSEIGIKKYGTTLSESKESLQAFVKHTFEEVLDTISYTEKILAILNNSKP